MTRRLSNAQMHRKRYSACFFCGNDNAAELDTHRIFPGEKGGKYDREGRNLICACAGCHRKLTVGTIIVDRKYPSSTGHWVVHYWADGQEKWVPEVLKMAVPQKTR